MDILSYVLGYNKGKAQGGGSGDDAETILAEVDARLDAINGGAVYTVTFIGGNGKTLCVVTVPSGSDCENPIDTGLIGTPIKNSTQDYDYTFEGWSLTSDGDVNEDALKNITASRTVYAVFSSLRLRGSLGSNARWQIAKPYTTLHFYGNGVIQRGTGAYSNHYPTVTEIQFHHENGNITGLGDQLFPYFMDVVRVEIPDTVESIGSATFSDTNRLKNIVIPSSVKSLGKYAFYQTYETQGLETATFEIPSGWSLYDPETGARVDSVFESTLADPIQAAKALKSDYADYVWKRS